jgi:hypothetical protein
MLSFFRSYSQQHPSHRSLDDRIAIPVIALTSMILKVENDKYEWHLGKVTSEKVSRVTLKQDRSWRYLLHVGMNWIATAAKATLIVFLQSYF